MDELNVLNRKSIDYEEYFGEMELTEEEKKERIRLAEMLEIVVLFYFLLLSESQTENYIQMIYEKYISVAMEFLKLSNVPSYLETYAREFAENVTRVTEENISDEYYTSKDRAMFIAENEANAMGNYRQQIEAVKSEMKYKTWKTKNDFRVRHTHKEVNERTIGIFDVFKVGDSEMMFPKDESLGASAQEIVNCRCVVHYS